MSHETFVILAYTAAFIVLVPLFAYNWRQAKKLERMQRDFEGGE